ncbi:homoserine dehydrogenase [Marivirga salinae]|uniref:Homoserine dehydrogenase n=1 Tax=Marivirga salinarum TaxID=3059078 RepID=A0AA49GB38_9BACT|nr:homoserine dehydrogenase [Marivirga sp. BDSF4-3]WKK78066.2 homoserine dehydrogenase [Marivirga sp. BDSF4-3]
MKKFKAGLFGLGVVGSGVYKALQQNGKYGISIEKIAVKNIDKKRDLELPNGILTTAAVEILDNTDLDIIIELINDPEEAFSIVKKAFKKGKSVVSANKKMVALYHKEILELREKHGVKFFYEGAVCGSVPILRLLDQHYKSDQVNSIKAIANGTCNFILSKMVSENQGYDLALKDAQDLGFAELDPYSDVSGEDTRFKLSIMIYHAFGLFIHPNEIPLQGINYLDENIKDFAQKHHLKIKLIGEAQEVNGKITAKVEPQLVNESHDFYNIENEYNGILVDAVFAGEQFVKGKGAGSFPTALAVLSNLKDLKYDLAVAKIAKKEIKSYSKNSKTEIYFIAGFNDNFNFQGLEVLNKEEGYILAKGQFDYLEELKKGNPDLYWVQLSENIFEELVNQEALI